MGTGLATSLEPGYVRIVVLALARQVDVSRQGVHQARKGPKGLQAENVVGV